LKYPDSFFNILQYVLHSQETKTLNRVRRIPSLDRIPEASIYMEEAGLDHRNCCQYHSAQNLDSEYNKQYEQFHDHNTLFPMHLHHNHDKRIRLAFRKLSLIQNLVYL